MTDTPERNEAAQEAKRRFRQALERKEHNALAKAAQEESRVKARHAGGPAGRRTFQRRKTG
ncbi:DUF5302 family protein [Streptomyces pristinaespiralis]|jgi:hypothetical protein|nr:DUF5302 family protein [Streptomyces pristinaespiralis]ALC18622.1 hypothetical protein SPRI_0316 [Streptomyces pristinaespiralis]ALC25343.1 hypothetical protein SPRI_7037 [Streptomyces pristinaespiralis]QMU12434.1 DUF5302 family protein [Streptomyces pristinaespiralis]